MEYSLKQEAEQVLSTGIRIAGTMVRYFSHLSRAKELRHSLTLKKVMKQKKWPDDVLLLTQIPKVGLISASRLLSAEISTFSDVLDTDPRKLEAVSKRPYPWGNQIQDAVGKLIPPQLDVACTVSNCTGTKWDFKVSIRLTDNKAKLNSLKQWCHVIVSSPSNQILVLRRISYASLKQFSATCSIKMAPKEQGVELSTYIIDETLVGVDVSIHCTSFSK